MKRVAAPVFVGLCAFFGGAVAVFLAQHLPAVFGRAAEEAKEESKLSERFQAVARKVSPSVVAIESIKPAPPGSKKKTIDDSGSGIIVRLPGKTALYAVTNNHVINKGTASQVTITLADNRALKPVRVLTDPESDLALLELGQVAGLTPVPLGDSDKMRVGQWVLAFGSPFGLNQTVTHGIISAVSRGQVSLGTTIRIKDFLQTDAAINPGSSGGALVNLDGEVIGINTAIASPSGGNTGISFSIPVNLVKKIGTQLLEKGQVTRGYLGVQLTAGFDSNEALRLGLAKAQGALVEAVHTQTPAFSAGLRRKDVLLELNGKSIRNDNDFINRVSSLPPGQKVRLKVWRDKKTITIDATVGDWNKAANRFKK